MTRFEKLYDIVEEFVWVPLALALLTDFVTLIFALSLCIEAWWLVNLAIALSIIAVISIFVWAGFSIAYRVVEHKRDRYEEPDNWFDEGNDYDLGAEEWLCDDEDEDDEYDDEENEETDDD